MTHASPPPPPDRARVLVVEDTPESQFLFERILARSYAVDIVGDLAAALAAARTRPYDAVLVDIHLKDGTSGNSLVAPLRALPGFAATPLAAVTAFGLATDRRRFLDAGFDDYLPKPFGAAELLLFVERLLTASPTTA